MTQDDFKAQIERLKSRFGERAFDNEFVKLIWKDCGDMVHGDFSKVVDTFLGSRGPNQAPLRADFREHRFQIERSRTEGDKRAPARVLHIGTGRPIAEILGPEFENANSIADAFKIARQRLNKKPDGEGA